MKMDSDESLELFPIPLTFEKHDFLYNDPLMVSGILRAVVDQDLNRIKLLVEAGKSINLNDNNGNTALHISVIKNNLEILEYLLCQENVTINGRNFFGHTPLFLAVKYDRFDMAKCLIDSGADVNIPNTEYVTPLHISIHHPDLAHLLIKNGAKIDIQDYNDDMPLHDAITSRACLEVVCMLLYYNADANAVGAHNLNPFMKALIIKDVDIQKALFEYTDDFNKHTSDGVSTLDIALSHCSTLIEQIIEKGAIVDLNAYSTCLRVPNTKNFQLIWERLNPEVITDFCLSELYSELNCEFLQEYLYVIIEHSQSSVLEVLATNISSDDLVLLIRYVSCCKKQFEDCITKFTFLLLLHGFELDSHFINDTFRIFGYCELFRMLLFIDYKPNWREEMITARLIFDIKTDIRIKCCELEYIAFQHTNSKYLSKDMRLACTYWSSHHFRGDLEGRLRIPKIEPIFPSLLEFARDATRKSIISHFNIKTTCQYFTIVNHLNVSPIYKKILMFEKMLYNLPKPNLLTLVNSFEHRNIEH